MRGALGSVPWRATLQEHDLTDWRAVDNRAVNLAHYVVSHSQRCILLMFNRKARRMAFLAHLTAGHAH
jgi:hypothetical protein